MKINRAWIRSQLELCEAATEGPWAWAYIGEKVNGYILGPAWDIDGKPLDGHIDDEYIERIGEARIVLGHEGATCNYRDPVFITTARTNYPAALRALEKAMRVVEAANKTWKWVVPCYRPNCHKGDCDQCTDMRELHDALAAMED